MFRISFDRTISKDFANTIDDFCRIIFEACERSIVGGTFMLVSKLTGHASIAWMGCAIVFLAGYNLNIQLLASSFVNLEEIKNAWSRKSIFIADPLIVGVVNACLGSSIWIVAKAIEKGVPAP
jgi:hypothetical protein